jgi:hypothetical protein
MLGMSVFYHLPYLLAMSLGSTIFAYLFVIFWTSKIKFINYDEQSISYKRKRIFYNIMTSIKYHKSYMGHSIYVKTFKKNSLNFNLLPNEKFKEIINVLSSKVDPNIIKKRKLRFLLLLNPLIIMILFIHSFILDTTVEKQYFLQNTSIQPNIETSNFSFRVSGIKFKTNISDNLYLVVTDEGKVNYAEFNTEGTSLRVFMRKRFPKYFLNDLSQIDYWFSNDFGIFKRYARLLGKKELQPIAFESYEFQGVLLRIENERSSLRIKKKDKEGFLKVDFQYEISVEQIQEFLESVSYIE